MTGHQAAVGDGGGTAGGRTMLLVVHTGRPEGVHTARLVAKRLSAAGVTVRVLASEAGDLRCPDAAMLPASPLAAQSAEMVLVIGGLSWMATARVVRGSVLSVKELDFITAARMLGMSNARIIFRHILPNTFGPIVVGATLSVGAAIITESALSFLGLGIRPPAISWGVLLQEAQNIQTVALAPWLMFPGVVVIIAVLAFNLVGDGLRDAAALSAGEESLRHPQRQHQAERCDHQRQIG